MPQAEYMYGCTPTALGMLLGYYDLYGYRGTDLSCMIEGNVDPKSRGTDGNAYDMDAFDTVLGRAIASEEYKYRFVSRNGKDTTPAQELPYTFIGSTTELNTSEWNCIADYIGTGQFWRGNGNLSTSITYGSLEELYQYEFNEPISDGATTKQVRYLYTAMLYGLDLYAQSRGYALDYEITGTYLTDVCGGEFTFEDYMCEIDSGRPVMISIEGHSMVGYGYNASTQEIIFDDCYRADQRMVWGGTYEYSGAKRALQTITVVGINVNGSVDLVVTQTAGSSEQLIVANTANALATPDYIFAGDPVYLTYTVSNEGPDPGGAFGVTVRVDGRIVSSGMAAPLAADASRKYADVSLGELSIGLHNVRVIVDESNEIQELSGLNNTAETDILVLKSDTSILTEERTVEERKSVSNTFVFNGGTLNLSGGSAFDTVLKGKVTSSSADGTTWYIPAAADVRQGGYMSSTDIYAYGEMRVSSGGTAVDTRVFSGGEVVIQDGGIASDVTVGSGGNLSVLSGGTLTGRIRLDSYISFYDGSILNFDLTDAAPGTAACVDDMSMYNGLPQFTLTLADTQAFGTYTLAKGAFGFHQTISVYDADGIAVEDISVGESFYVGTNKYSLDLSDGVLSFTITGKAPSDTSAPTVTNVKASSVAPTSRNVTVTADFSDNIAIASKLYRIGDGEWLAYVDGVTVAENATVYFKAVDTAGNKSEIVSYTVTNIDKVAPARPTAAADVTVLTNCDVHVSAVFSEDSAVGEYSLDGTNWLDYTDSIVLTENGTVFFRATDAAGNQSEITSYIVSNIDKVAPVKPTASASVTATTSNDVTVTAKFSKDTVMKEYSLDGETWTAYTNAIVFTKNGIVYFRGTDAAGNVSEITPFEVANINKGCLDDGSNDWLYDRKKKQKRNPDENFAAFTLEEGVSEIRLDPEGTVEDETRHNFVGIGDTTDFAKFTLNTAAKLFFTLDATGATKFTVWSLTEGKDKKGNTTWTQKSLQSTALKKVKGSTDYAATTKALLLNAGDYYVSMQSTNKKNGYALYNVTISEASIFYKSGDNTDAWTDMKEKGWSGAIDDRGTVTAATDLVKDEWAGFGDKVDCKKFTLASAAELSLSVSAQDGPLKLSVCRLKETTSKKGVTTYSQVTVKSVTVKAGQPKSLDSLRLAAGDYFFKVESTNVKKSTGYSVQIADGEFYTDGDDGWNNVLLDGKTLNENEAYFYDNKLAGSGAVHLDKAGNNKSGSNYATFTCDGNSYGGFVGFGDETDFAKLTLTETSDVTFTLDATNDATLEIFKVTKNGEKYSKKSIQTVKYKSGGDAVSSKKPVTLEVKDGVSYYVSVKATNTRKTTVDPRTYYNVSYDIAPEGISSALAMPETDALASALTMPDGLNLGQYNTDVLAGSYLDSASDKLFGESGTGLLASL